MSLQGQEMTLKNGIVVKGEWPPRIEYNYAPMDLPYMQTRPELVPIDCGRQLFVDDYLIESSTLTRTAHTPKKVSFNPIFKPETQLEMGNYGNPGATAKDGGIWWDPQAGIFKMWYEAGWLQTMAYAESLDGIHWTRPVTEHANGTNALVSEIVADSSTAWLDLFTDNPDQRYKMFLRSPNTVPGTSVKYRTGWCMTSPDGIHWDHRMPTGPCGDRSTIFYNPFIGKWVYSIRNSSNVNKESIGRYRQYYECEDFLKGAGWTKDSLGFWLGADSLDVVDPEIGDAAQLYNLSAVAYESIMLALPQIHLGPSNDICRKNGTPKITDLKVAYSRDGFHWDRRDRQVYMASERKNGYWDRGYVQSVGGICNIVGDQLWFHYIGFSGNDELKKDVYEFNGMHYGGAVGMAVMRRDGFVSHDAGIQGGELVTCPVIFSGENLFVNVNCPAGQLKVEVLDVNGNVIPGFSAAECKALSIDSTISEVKWKGASIKTLKGKGVKFRFILQNGELYAFWVSPDKSGASNGYTAAGGPGLSGGIDKDGLKSYKKASEYMLKKY